ncbi:MAG: AMP-binding protein, partial [Muribaculaceae bacterium]|nr:AMP-binding protein [Muribaculaceae bacterium]
LEEVKLPGLTAALYLSEEGIAFSRSKNLTKARNDLNELFGKEFPKDFAPADVEYYRDSPDQLAVINYTSGSTGSPKGVMLPYLSIWSNIRYCIDHLHFLKPGDGMVNMLPLGHLYGMVIEMLHPLVKGCHCCFLTKAPSPKVLLAAFAEVRPKLIITVPLVLEKIIKSRVFPQLEKPMMKFAISLPFINNKIYAKVREKLIEVFGGQVEEVIIGGAPLNAEVEKFLYRIKFPVTVGYGMTESGPLLTYAPPQESEAHSVGRIVDRMEVKIDSPDPVNIPGNIMVKGANVMKGYYKNEKATAEVFPHNDGWMNTGDMGTISPDGFIFISGRSKTMILGPSGQNIYPEEIEQKINNRTYVEE